ncbi:hypothetical protein CGLO_12208 [Colletotrichum gloeosporioides Cg-14]|uniref:Uncharacterized protein n=1 Tax=Colletotrichum gloeosporioides (strain Cg-14) TaxID=1237896 RepID=T0LA45_COLGC|nr:hypothetical protein CGLO_12208 [Colletotrichum gloeosporioides Cg-14]
MFDDFFYWKAIGDVTASAARNGQLSANPEGPPPMTMTS